MYRNFSARLYQQTPFSQEIEERDWKRMRGLSEILAHPCFDYAHAVLYWQPETWSLLEGQRITLASEVLHRAMPVSTMLFSTYYSCNLHLKVSTKGVS